MIGGLRLIDSVAVAAGALLCLKVIALANGPGTAEAPASDKATVAAEQSQAFARALAQARTNYVVPEVTMTNAVTKPEAAPGPKKDDAPAVASAQPAPAVPASTSERTIMERLGERREEWQQKGKDLELRERMLEDVQRKLETRINDLKTLEEQAETNAAKRGETEAAHLKNLVIMYEAMKPKEAARVFDRLPHDVLVPVVLQMNPRKMAEVLAMMSPETAERLTVALATRNRPKPEPAAARQDLPTNELPAIDQPLRRD